MSERKEGDTTLSIRTFEPVRLIASFCLRVRDEAAADCTRRLKARSTKAEGGPPDERGDSENGNRIRKSL